MLLHHHLTTLLVKVLARLPFGHQLFWFRKTFLQIKMPAPKFQAPWQPKWSQLGGLLKRKTPLFSKRCLPYYTLTVFQLLAWDEELEYQIWNLPCGTTRAGRLVQRVASQRTMMTKAQQALCSSQSRGYYGVQPTCKEHQSKFARKPILS